MCKNTDNSDTWAGRRQTKQEKQHAHCLHEFGKPVRKELKMLTFLKTRPGCWENWSSPLQARPKVNWSVTEEGGAAPEASVSSSAMKHSIVLQTPPISLLPPNPSTALDVLLSYCLIGCAKCRSKYPVKKTLAACQHYKTNYGARRLSRFKVPSPFKTEWSKQAVGFCF